MFPDPLHPAIVHFPVVLSVFAPAIAAIGFWAISRGRLRARSWVGVIVLQTILFASTWAATETGEQEEELVEKYVAERLIEEHEEAGERLRSIAAITLPVAAIGLMSSPIGTVARGVTVALSLGGLAAAGSAGHSGGELVYRHGAARAYAEQFAGGGVAGTGTPRPFEERKGKYRDDDD